MPINYDGLNKQLAERANGRKQLPNDQREAVALEGIQDELTKLNALVAAMLLSRR